MSRRIVVLDEVELDKGSIDRLSAAGEVTWYHDNPQGEDEIVARLAGAEIAVLGWTSVADSVLARLPDLRFIAVWATGYDYVDVAAAAKRGIPVSNIPSYAGSAVSELALGLMLSVNRDILRADDHVRKGGYSWKGFRARELRGSTLGVVGVGDIGGQLARAGRALGMNVLAHARRTDPERAAELGVTFVGLPELLAASDFVSLHVPLSDQTRGLIGAEELRTMKKTAVLINTTRAAVVDQAALVAALAGGEIAGAGLDEIAVPDPAVLALPNVVLTPHIGFNTDEAVVRKGDVCVSNVEAYLRGAPVNVVNAQWLGGRG
ncbi:2-hydroxyacid dehydrogenase [Actinacidiphila epipremni]|uniref:Glycerate dehydrogenase n=1 Tax=Actinacidiphila epipremni TaxID=2053013 RepID=A0ABX0ZQ48_9ACTN|nr:NAD(P)-dependent oxidoreductase [Actinacidiphila epipremni]NJP46039.1 glycerate dehydrogenase [Actinacidiphila epipremni]